MSEKVKSTLRLHLLILTFAMYVLAIPLFYVDLMTGFPMMIDKNDEHNYFDELENVFNIGLWYYANVLAITMLYCRMIRKISKSKDRIYRLYFLITLPVLTRYILWQFWFLINVWALGLT